MIKDRGMEKYKTGTGLSIIVHSVKPSCMKYGCCIHNPSNHSMKDFPTNWRFDADIMERVCPHGIGHPDPDSVDYVRRKFGKKAASRASVHGCDGCCRDKIN